MAMPELADLPTGWLERQAVQAWQRRTRTRIRGQLRGSQRREPMEPPAHTPTVLAGGHDTSKTFWRAWPTLLT